MDRRVKPGDDDAEIVRGARMTEIADYRDYDALGLAELVRRKEIAGLVDLAEARYINRDAEIGPSNYRVLHEK